MKFRLLFFLTIVLQAASAYCQVPQSEREALEKFFETTNGWEWDDNQNWLTNTPVENWFGVTVQNIDGQDHVVTLGFDILPNNLNGYLPEELGDLTKLQSIFISYNPLLTGEIPASLGQLQRLETIEMQDNGFTGSLPIELANCSKLQSVYLENNQLSGSIPAEYANIHTMWQFRVGGNRLSGPIPDNLFSSWDNLASLSLHNMEISGTVDLSQAVNFNFILWLQNTLISEVNLQNGHNAEIPTEDFLNNCNFTGTPELSCIFVDDADYSVNNWPLVDNPNSYVETQEECDNLVSSKDLIELDAKLFPNPTAGIVTIDFLEDFELEELVVFNSIGEIMAKGITANNINITDFPTGVYFIKLINSEHKYSIHKIMKE